MTTLIDVRLPHMGVVEQAVLTTWLRSPGDRVEESDPLCEVSTDKVDTEVVSPVSGILIDYVAQVDDEVPVGAVIARFAALDASEAEVADAIRASAQESAAPADPADTVTATGAAPMQDPPAVPSPATAVPAPPSVNGQAAASTREAADVPTPVSVDLPEQASLVLKAAWFPIAPPPVEGQSGPRRDKPATPLVRKLAKERGIDLAALQGTGPGGRVTRKDVEAAAAAQEQPIQSPGPTQATQPRQVAAPPTPQPTRTDDQVELPKGYASVAYEAMALSPQRRAIARNLVESVSTAPQLTAQIDIDMSTLSRVRAEINQRRLARGESKLSFLPFIARALCATAVEHPDINATFTESHLLRWRPVNLGIAVDAPQGLLVPVIRDAERLTVPALAEAITLATTRVIERKAAAEDLSGGTITISNSGSVGGVISTPILTRPQVTSLGIPAIVRTPVAVTAPNGDEYVAIRPIARVGLTFDHRAYDGAAALRALQGVQHKLETWSAEAYL